MEHHMHFFEDYRDVGIYAQSGIWFVRVEDTVDNTHPDVEDTYCGSIIVEPADIDGYSIYMAYFSNESFQTTSDLLFKVEPNETPMDLLLQIHSHINKCGPFKSTGFTSSYKETGAYSDPVPVTHPRILALDVEKYEYAKPCAAVVVDDRGDICNVLSICPYA